MSSFVVFLTGWLGMCTGLCDWDSSVTPYTDWRRSKKTESRPSSWRGLWGELVQPLIQCFQPHTDIPTINDQPLPEFLQWWELCLWGGLALPVGYHCQTIYPFIEASLYMSVSSNMVHRPSAKKHLGAPGKDARCRVPHGPTESESLWVGLKNLYISQLPQVILRHEPVRGQLLKIVHKGS